MPKRTSGLFFLIFAITQSVICTGDLPRQITSLPFQMVHYIIEGFVVAVNTQVNARADHAEDHRGKDHIQHVVAADALQFARGKPRKLRTE